MIFIPRELVDRIREHGRVSYPHEGCGLMIGPDGERDRVVELRMMENKYDAKSDAESRRNRYTIDPLELLKAERTLDGSGKEIIGVFHSHPDHPARPSSFDLEHAWPGWHYVIVSVVAGEPEQMRSWAQREDRSQFDEESMEVV